MWTCVVCCKEFEPRKSQKNPFCSLACGRSSAGRRYECEKRKDKIKEYGKQHYLKNKERLGVWRKAYYAKNAENGKQKTREYNAAHPEWKHKYDAEWHSRVRFGGNRFKALERDGYACQICGSKGPRLHVHHLDETGMGPSGNHDLSNLMTICVSCHASLHAGRGVKNQTMRFRERAKATILERDAYRCVKCGGTQGPLYIDHIIPVSHGGTNGISNGQTLCHTCHVSKTTDDRNALKHVS
jgi:5-methylcytosine-specific restriction endonuclease McrA